MKNLNLKNLKIDNYNGLEFISSPDINSWYIVFSRIDSTVYSGHLGLDNEFQGLDGNIIVLKNDNYVENIELIIQENIENTMVYYRMIEEENFKLIAMLDSNLEVLGLGTWDDNDIDLNQQSFLTMEDLIKRIDEYFFYEFFEGY